MKSLREANLDKDREIERCLEEVQKWQEQAQNENQERSIVAQKAADLDQQMREYQKVIEQQQQQLDQQTRNYEGMIQQQ